MAISRLTTISDCMNNTSRDESNLVTIHHYCVVQRGVSERVRGGRITALQSAIWQDKLQKYDR